MSVLLEDILSYPGLLFFFYFLLSLLLIAKHLLSAYEEPDNFGESGI